jgi:TetR/AcrR family transcriptional repressor of nem operon
MIPTSWYTLEASTVTVLAQHDSKTKVLDAALQVVRAKGYAATTVDDICASAGLTKGSFFHHFKSKDEVAIEAVRHWQTVTDAVFAMAPYQQANDPLDRVLGYLDFRGEILEGNPRDYTCLLGTLVQETYETHSHIRAACNASLSAHVRALTRDLEAAKKLYAPKASWRAETVGYFIESVLQGSFIFAKARTDAGIVRDNLAQLRRYVGALFDRSRPTKTTRRR